MSSSTISSGVASCQKPGSAEDGIACRAAAPAAVSTRGCESTIASASDVGAGSTFSTQLRHAARNLDVDVDLLRPVERERVLPLRVLDPELAALPLGAVASKTSRTTPGCFARSSSSANPGRRHQRVAHDVARHEPRSREAAGKGHERRVQAGGDDGPHGGAVRETADEAITRRRRRLTRLQRRVSGPPGWMATAVTPSRANACAVPACAGSSIMKRAWSATRACQARRSRAAARARAARGDRCPSSRAGTRRGSRCGVLFLIAAYSARDRNGAEVSRPMRRRARRTRDQGHGDDSDLA